MSCPPARSRSARRRPLPGATPGAHAEPARDARSRTPRVFVLTFCGNEELFYGSELVFKTLRVGFPNARVSVVDNGSLPEARRKIGSLARALECDFEALGDARIPHHRFLLETIRAAACDRRADGPIAFVDPDVCLWSSCEDLDVEGLAAGQYCPSFDDHVTRTVTLPRLHTSFLWIPDPRALWEAFRRIRREHFDFEPFRPHAFRLDGSWYRFDTGAGMYAALQERMNHFSAKHLDLYDHIYAGSHVDRLQPAYDEHCQRMFRQVHGAAKDGKLEELRGIWRYQHAVFRRSSEARAAVRAPDAPQEPRTGFQIANVEAQLQENRT